MTDWKRLFRALMPLAFAVAAGCAASGTSGSSLPDARRATSALAPVAAGHAVYAWGGDRVGQLGDGKTTDRYVPGRVHSVPGTIAMTGGGAHGLILTSGGNVWAWGWNHWGELGVGTSTGPQQCPLGGRAGTACSTLPVQVSGISGVTKIAAGDLHSFVLTSDGSVWAWGSNQYGQIGTGSITTTGCLCIDSPARALVPSGIVALSGGGYHSLALRNDGTVWAWGDNQYGEIGDGSTTNRATPVQVTGLSGVVAIAGGFYHSLALTSDGNVYAWGRNLFGQLGNGSTVQSAVPVRVHGLTGVTYIAGGGEYSLAVRSDGTVWTWGDNAQGQLGDGSHSNSSIPVQVTGLTGITAIGSGHRHGLAVDGNGVVWAWGQNQYGELGNGTTTSSDVPVRANVTGLAYLGGGEFYSIGFK